ncbi:MAG: radical SAM protein [bacterium]|nr:radical SAM protein [bacterium]
MIDTLHLGLSYSCNMKCKHCFVDKQKDNLDIDKLKKTIDYLDKNGLFFVIYTFGEPLLAKEFWNIAEYVSGKKIIQTLMTNGSLITKNNIKKLKKNHINNIYISLDSVHEVKHDLNRGYNGSFKRAINAFKLLQYDFNVGMAITVNDNNINEMNEFVELAERIGIKNISFLRQRENNSIIKLSKKDEYEEFYIKYLCSDMKINILFHDPSLLKITNDLYRNNKIDLTIYEKYYDMNSCHYNTTLSIEPNGNVKHCNLINKNIGNINDNNIEKILKIGSEKNECISYCAKLSK